MRISRKSYGLAKNLNYKQPSVMRISNDSCKQNQNLTMGSSQVHNNPTEQILDSKINIRTQSLDNINSMYRILTTSSIIQNSKKHIR